MNRLMTKVGGLILSETYNTKNTTVNLDSNNLTKESILESIKIFDEPYSDPSTIPSYFLAKTISNNFKVAISGDGGDELFGGYERLQLTMQKKNIANTFLQDFTILSSLLRNRQQTTQKF